MVMLKKMEDKLTERQFRQFLENTDKLTMERWSSDDMEIPLDTVLMSSFIWERTPQGHIYWSDIKDMLEE